MKNARALLAAKKSAMRECRDAIDADTSYGEALSAEAVRFSTSMCSTVTAGSPSAPPGSSPCTSGSAHSSRPDTRARCADRLAPKGSSPAPIEAASRTSGDRLSSSRCMSRWPPRPSPFETTKNSSALLRNARQPAPENSSWTSRYSEAWSICRRCSLSLPSLSVHGPYPEIFRTVSCTCARPGGAARPRPAASPVTRSSPARRPWPRRPRRPSRRRGGSARTRAARACPAR